jgi:hypothetical protein
VPAATAPPAEAAAKPEEVKYEPLEKVKEQIRDTIASQKAAEKIEEIFGDLSSQMRRYAAERADYEARDKNDTTLKAPAPFPFAELAKKYAVEARELPLVTTAEAAAEDIGKVSRIVPDNRSPMGFRSEAFAEFAFSDSLPAYKYTQGSDPEGNGFLFWKTEEQKPYVPKFAQVREKVLAAWKMIEARAIARKRADELAAQARTANKPLKEAFADQAGLKVIDTGSFTWMTTGNVPQDPSAGAPRISQIEGVVRIGDAFMQTVFGLQAGQVGVASNHPQDTVYVVRLAEYEQPLDQLRDEFAREPAGVYMVAATTDRQQMFQTWINDLEKEANIHWLRTPDVIRQNESEEPQGQASL